MDTHGEILTTTSVTGHLLFFVPCLTVQKSVDRANFMFQGSIEKSQTRHQMSSMLQSQLDALELRV